MALDGHRVGARDRDRGRRRVPDLHGQVVCGRRVAGVFDGQRDGVHAGSEIDLRGDSRGDLGCGFGPRVGERVAIGVSRGRAVEGDGRGGAGALDRLIEAGVCCRRLIRRAGV